MIIFFFSCLVLIPPRFVFAGRIFDVYKGRLTRLQNVSIIDAGVVTSLGQCSRFCLDSGVRCQAANLVPIRAGVYSCELIGGFRSDKPSDLQTCKAGAFLQRKDLCKLCSRYAVCSPKARPPYYSCQCSMWCGGPTCHSCYGIPALFAPVVPPSRCPVRVLEEDGWIVLMRRKDGSLEFENKTWDEYKYGFGTLEGEFWLGNEYIHQLTLSGRRFARFDLVSPEGEWAYAEYSDFWVGPESDNYRLHCSGYSGNATDALNPGPSYYNQCGMLFTTIDKDNDRYTGGLCERGGWWYNHCGYARLTLSYKRLIQWFPFCHKCIYVDIKIRSN